MEEGRATECEHTIGDLVERARRHDISAPILTAARCNLQVYETLRREDRMSQLGDRSSVVMAKVPHYREGERGC